MTTTTSNRLGGTCTASAVRGPGGAMALLLSMLSVASFFAILSLSGLKSVDTQYAETSVQYSQGIAEGEAALLEQVSSNPDVNVFFHPDRALINNNKYIYDYPRPEYYRVSILMDPCKHLAYNCCMNVFGSAQYPSMKINPLEQERVNKRLLLGPDDAVKQNYNLVYSDGTAVPAAADRSADDEAIIDFRCESLRKPFDFCASKHVAFNRSSERPACNDNNYSVNAMLNCWAPDGSSVDPHCIQVGYSSTAFLAQCIDDTDPHCGTFLEIHMRNGSPYQAEGDVISDVRIDATLNVSGVFTTTMSLNWMKDPTRVLCSYTESKLRVGSLVYILPSGTRPGTQTPICCCPGPFQPDTRVGSFFCPIGPQGSGALSAGAYAYTPKTLDDIIVIDGLLLKYPFCNIDITSTYDLLRCSHRDAKDRRHYTRPCLPVNLTSGNLGYYGSSDLAYQQYQGVCPYYDGCAITLDNGRCQLTDLRFTFIGQVGIVTALDNTAAVPTADVSFNDGRTSYTFLQEQVRLETPRLSMYEVWWVQRTKSNYIIQQRKGFNVSYPPCTFDTTNDRYFPWANLNAEGQPVDSTSLYTAIPAP